MSEANIYILEKTIKDIRLIESELNKIEKDCDFFCFGSNSLGITAKDIGRENFNDIKSFIYKKLEKTLKEKKSLFESRF